MGADMVRNGMVQRWRFSRLWIPVLIFGALTNLLMLTGPLFMLQVYERVLPSSSVPTLAVLFALVVFLYVIMALLDSARSRILIRIAARLRKKVERRLLDARLRCSARPDGSGPGASALQDLEIVHRTLSSPAVLAMLDTPWTFAFLALLFVFHPLLGLLATFGGVALIALAFVGHWRVRTPLARAQIAGREADSLVSALDADLISLAALGMDQPLAHRWQAQRDKALVAMLTATDRSAIDGALARSFRLLMQSSILALGALLVIRGSASAGVIVAASILMGRALMPVEILATQWPGIRAALSAWRRIEARLERWTGPGFESPATAIRPGPLLAQHVIVTPASGGAPILRIKGFEVPQGGALGVIGPSGSGKSTLAAALVGAVPVIAGALRLGDTALPLPRPVGRALGYLPQRVALLDGTVADNIARFSLSPDPSEIERAARLAGIHDVIIALPGGYRTRIHPGDPRFSGGEAQRLGLARALFGDPPLVILDEPNAHLDAVGSDCLNRAIRAIKARGAVVLVMAHRPAAIAECESLLVLEAGAQVAFGPRETVLRESVRNHMALVSTGPRTAP
jgi:ATP-binding cassette subfamily C protein